MVNLGRSISQVVGLGAPMNLRALKSARMPSFKQFFKGGSLRRTFSLGGSGRVLQYTVDTYNHKQMIANYLFTACSLHRYQFGLFDRLLIQSLLLV